MSLALVLLARMDFAIIFLALLVKLYECTSVADLDSEEDMQPKRTYISNLQHWSR